MPVPTDPYYTPAHQAALQAAESPAVINAGNLGAAYQLDMTGHVDVLLVGTLNTNCVITVTGLSAGASFTLELHQDAVGNRVATLPAQAGGANQLQSPANAVDVVTYYTADGTTLRGFVQGSDVLPAYDRSQALAGMFCCHHGFGNPAAAGFANPNEAAILRFVPSRRIVVASVSFAVTVAAGTDVACDVGIYDGALTRLVSAGATTGKLNTVGAKTVPLSVTLQPNTVYYAAISAAAVGASILGMSYGDFRASQLFGGGPPDYLALRAQTAHPLPASLAGAVASSSVPMLAVREF